VLTCVLLAICFESFITAWTFLTLPASKHLGRRQALLGSGAEFGLGLAVLQPGSASAELTPDEKAAVNLFSKTSNSVLSINAADVEGSSRQHILASGFAWDRNHVVTTATGLNGVQRPKVTIITKDASGEEKRKSLTGAIVGTDPVTDIAVLWVDGNMQPLRMGSSEDLEVGEEVFSFGAPYGLEHSMTKGIVSGVSRTMVGGSGRPVDGVIQTDALIHPGSNGGPMLNSEGAVVGVNSAVMTADGPVAGLGLAIPIEAVQRSVTSVILQGHVATPSMGVVLAQDTLSQGLGLDGVLVRKVDVGGPADRAGIRPMRGGILGDVIFGIDSKPVVSSQDVFKALSGKVPGEDVVLSVRRAGPDADSDTVTFNLKVELGSRIL